MRGVGLIVVDEEHDPAYKQESDPRYDARTVAAKRAALEGAVAVYGSATPRPESWARLRRSSLSARIGAPLPRVRLVDLRREDGYPLSAPLLQRARRSRRGRWARDPPPQPPRRRAGRPLSSVRRLATLRPLRRRTDAALGRRPPLPSLRPLGARFRACARRAAPSSSPGSVPGRSGSSRSSRAACPSSSGSGSTRTSRAARARCARPIERFRQADRTVLIGTQIVAKGHHFPGVALAAVIDADTGLSLPDFRAEERTFQLVTQLAGRSGRDAPGRVLVQTFQPDATPLRHAVNHDVAGFLAGELERREVLGYPPFRHLVSILVSGPEREAPLAALRELRARLDGVEAELLGPAPAAAARAPSGAADREDDAAALGRPPGVGAARRGRADDAPRRSHGRRRRRSAVAVEPRRGRWRSTATIRDDDAARRAPRLRGRRRRQGGRRPAGRWAPSTAPPPASSTAAT